MSWPTCPEALRIPIAEIDVRCILPLHHAMDGQTWHWAPNTPDQPVLWQRSRDGSQIEIRIGDCRGFDPGSPAAGGGMPNAKDPGEGDRS